MKFKVRYIFESNLPMKFAKRGNNDKKNENSKFARND